MAVKEGEAKLIVQKEEVQQIDNKPSLREILKNRSYMLIFGGVLSTVVAGSFSGLAISYWVYSTTQNAALMGLLAIFGSLPTILISTFAGVLTDRFDQRKILLFSIITRVVAATGFVVIYLLKDMLTIHLVITETLSTGQIIITHVYNHIHLIWLLYTLIFIHNAAASFFTLVTSAYTKLVVQKKNLLVANSFSSAVIQMAFVIGSIVAGVIVSISYLYSFILCGTVASFAVIFISLLMMVGQKPPKVEKPESTTFGKEVKRVIEDVKVGYKAILAEPKVLYVLIVYMVFNLATATINAVSSVVLQGEVGLNATWYGLRFAFLSAIAILTAVVIMKIGRINRKLVLVNLVIFLEAAGLLLFAFIRNPWIVIFVITIPFGIVNGAANIPSFTLRQEKIPFEKQGRVTATAILLTSLANIIGMTIVTSIANFIAPMYILLIGGGISLILGTVGTIGLLSKEELRCSDYREEKEAAEEASLPLHEESKDLVIPIKKTVQKVAGVATPPRRDRFLNPRRKQIEIKEIEEKKPEN